MASNRDQRRVAQERAAAVRAARARVERRNRLLRAAAVSAGVVVLIAVVVTVGLVHKSTPKAGVASGVASAAVVSAIEGVPASTEAAVGAGKTDADLRAITGPALTANNKPRVLYIGAEFCPYCAAERWAVVQALSRFGTFTHLGATHSSASDIYPNTATLSFHGAMYASDVLSFTGVETESNQPSGNGYTSLDTPTVTDQQLLATYDAPPYVPSSSAGSIPFVDIGGRWLISGATYNPQLLAGKTAEQIAASLADPTSPIAQAILGTANRITAALCQLSSGKPAGVCSAAPIPALIATLPHG